MISNEFIKALVKLRRNERNLTQHKLGELSGTCGSQVGRLERCGYISPSPMYRVMKYLGLLKEYGEWMKQTHPKNYQNWLGWDWDDEL